MSLADHHNHFLDLADLADGQLRHLLDAAAARKAARTGLPKGMVDEDAPLAGICWPWCLKNRQPAQGCPLIWGCANWAGRR